MRMIHVLILTAVLWPSAALPASMHVQADGRVCYNAECLGYYDTPLVQCEPRQHAPLPPMDTRDYAAIRKDLVAVGWRPVLNTASPDSREQWAVDAGFLEIEGCAGSVDVCSFGFTDRTGAYLRVVEHIDRVTAFFPCDD